MNVCKRILLSATLAVAILALGQGFFTAPGHAQEEPSGGFRIGVVNSFEVFNSYEKKDEMLGEIEAEKTAREAELKSLIDELSAWSRSQQERLQSADTSSSALEDFRAEYENRERDIQIKKQDITSELQSRTDRVMRTLRREVLEAVQQVGNDQNYHIILDLDSNQGMSPVLYHSTTVDLTQAVVDQLDANYQRQASNAGSGAAAPEPQRG